MNARILALFGGGLLGALLAVHSRGTLDIPAGAGVRHDDFIFTVVSAERSSPTLLAVSLAIENQARRVDYVWNPSTAYVVDGAGRRYEPDFGRSRSLTIAPGSRSVQRVVYRIAADARDLRLGYWDGVLMGDVFDGLHYARVRVALTR